MISVVTIYKDEDLTRLINSIPSEFEIILCRTLQRNDKSPVENVNLDSNYYHNPENFGDRQIKFITYFYDEFDFSEARNFAKSKAKYEWILSLDADEELTNSSQDFQEWINTDKLAVSVMMFSPERIYNKLQNTKIFQSVRLFRNSLNWVYDIHELVDVKEEFIDKSDLLIKHHGYNVDHDTIISKCYRNLNMLLNSKYRDDLYILKYLKRTLEDAEKLGLLDDTK